MKKLLAALSILTFAVVLVPRLTISAASPGDLIKGTPSAVYYVTAQGTRLAFPNESTYFSWYSDFSGVKIVSDAEVASLQLTGLVTIRPGRSVVKIQTDDHYYAVAHGGVLRRLETAAIAAMIFGADWAKKMVIIPDAFLTSYTMGEIVNGPGQYWWKVEQDSSPDIAQDIAVSSPDPVANTNQPSNNTNQNTNQPAANNPTAPLPNDQPADPATPVLQSFTTVPRTNNYKKYDLAVGLWNPHDPVVAATPSKETITKMLFSGNGSEKNVSDYYKQMSGGAVELQNAGVFGWYDADKPASHYWTTPDPTDADQDGFVNGHNEKWAETIKKMDAEFDFSAYDVNHDGILAPDELAVLVVIPTNDPFGTNRVVYAQEYPSSVPMMADGVRIGMIAEWYTGNPPNFGVVAHELSHLLFNTADMYATSQYRAANLSLMDGTYCNCSLDPWHRLADGRNWLNILTPGSSGYYELSSINTSFSVMKILRPDSDEFFLVEYRQNDKYNDVGMPGLLVWNIKNSSITGDWGRDNIRLLRANGGVPLDDAKASYHGSISVPATTGILKWFDGTSSGISITDIGIAESTIKFKLNLAQ